MLTIAAFVVTIALLVTIHEFGHYQVARWCGVKVLRFSIGFGKPLLKITYGKDRTEFVLATIPLGGYVKMLDERVLAQEADNPSNEGTPIYSEQELNRAFNRQSVWKRIAIVAAGPAANLLLAILIYWALFMSGTSLMRPIIGGIVQNSPAASAQLMSGDLIKKIDGTSVASWQEVRWILLKKSLTNSSNQSTKLELINADKEAQTVQLNLNNVDKNNLELDILEQLGLIQYQPKIAPIVGEVTPNSVAAKAGLLSADKILAINNQPVTDWSDFVKVVRASPNVAVQVQYERINNGIKTQKIVAITPSPILEGNHHVGRIGVAAKLDRVAAQENLDKQIVTVYYAPLQALTMAVDKTWDTSIFSLNMLGKMLTGQMSLKGLSGPATIANFAGQSADLGFKVFLGFLATISISIGILNLLPIPVLDGGHLLYYTVEIFKGSPVSERTMEFGQRVGLGVLGLLISVAIFNDISRFTTVFFS